MSETGLLQVSNEIYIYAALLLKNFKESTDVRLQNHGQVLSGQQYSILRMIRFEELTISTLSQRMSIDPSSMVRIIDSLEKKGLAERSTDPQDRRRNPIRITPKGQDLVEAVPVISENDAVFLALKTLGDAPVVQLRDLLRQVVQQFPEGRVVSALIAKNDQKISEI